MRAFESLTKLGRARRLRRIASKAMEAYELDVARIRFVNNEANCTFRVHTADGASYALRINLPGMRTRQEIRSELLWQEALWRDTDVPVPQPIRTSTGDLVVAASSEGVPEMRLCNLSSWRYGRTLSRSKTPGNFRRLGALAAQIHAHGAAFKPPTGFDVPTLDTVIATSRPDALIKGGGVEQFSGSARTLILNMNATLQKELQRIFQSPAKLQLIHGDLHWWNVLVYRSALSPIDFEDCAWARPVQEIAITFYYVLWDERFSKFFAAFREGYEQRLSWPEEYDGQIALLMGQRALDLLNLLLLSPYPNERELIPEYVEIIDRTYRQHFERWQRSSS